MFSERVSIHLTGRSSLRAAQRQQRPPRRRSAAWSRSRRRRPARPRGRGPRPMPSRMREEQAHEVRDLRRASRSSARRRGSRRGRRAARSRAPARAVVDHAALDDVVGLGEAPPRGRRRRATSRATFVPSPSWTSVSSLSASSGSTTTGSGSYSTATSLGGVDDGVAVVADDDGDGVADVLDLPLASGQCSGVLIVDAGRDPGHRQRRRRDRRRPRRWRRHDVVARLRGGGVDRDDARVRLGRADERRPERARQRDVLDVVARPVMSLRVLLALHRLADPLALP